MHNHQSTHARPDEKMGRRLVPKRVRYNGTFRYVIRLTSRQRQQEKRSAAKKRRQRDRLEAL